jgi:phospholipase D1/2
MESISGAANTVARPGPPEASAAGLLQPGRNCWRLERAHRFSLLVDADAYFRAVRGAVARARHSVFVLSWDIDSRACLVPAGAADGYPECLGDFLHALVAERPDLQVYLLTWDFAMLYAFEREWPTLQQGWHTGRRLKFFMDGAHPVGASHHQKVVVVDDAVAFVGGLDLTRARWDRPEHAADNPLRRDGKGKPYGPFHDVQSVVDGAAARALGDLVRMRWRRATGAEPAAPVAGEHDPWPADLPPDLIDVDVALVRTEPAFDGRPGVYETRQMYLDAIAAARHSLFFESQYFTSGLIGDALAARLAQQQGPDIAVVSPETQCGWLEETTMGVLRTRLHRRLRAADRGGRYRLYAPRLPGLADGCLNVHSKVFVMDDDLFSVGSANLSNRSMALDTECNLAFEARGSEEEKTRIRAAIAALRSRLLAEHLAATPRAVEAETRRRGLIGAIEGLRQPGRSLCPLEPSTAPELDALVPDSALIDPERPIDPDELMALVVPKDTQPRVPRRLLALGALGIAFVLLAVGWRWTPLREWLNLASLVSFVHGLAAQPFAPIAVIGGYVLAGLLVVPVTLLIAATGIVFGPAAGIGYAMAGALSSAAVTYLIGRSLGRKTVGRFLGPRLNRLSRRIAKRGVLAMVILRTLPIAPFSIVNVVAGASHIGFRDYMLGTGFGMTPGILIIVTFVHNLVQALSRPSIGSIAVLAALAATLIGSAVVLLRLRKAKRLVEEK